MEGAELEELQKLHDSVYEQATSWFTSLKDNMKSQILSHFGQLPGKEADIQVQHNTVLSVRSSVFLCLAPGYLGYGSNSRFR